ncbi:glutathione S-transferase [Pseudoalteromonas sp. A25]|uniref:glutathione S-transferase family protein n=1 Tax=Pseudoalteromonas sp. A25 TaxID=116092 RepID=UPI0012613541|nr:glutathione S-transferase [Pseudoalteromonas sp. A25]BBN83557.1 glutathione S-transferase [Pseudoalteromonas sp. A25]
MIKVHHLNQSRSTRILWLLEELGLPYEVERHERDSATRLAPASLAKVHPLSKAPIIEHNGLVLCESGAIIEYILDQAPSEYLRPEKGSKAYFQYLEWLHFAEGSLGLPIIARLLMNMEQRDGTKPMDGYISKELNLDFSYIDNVLAKQNYFAGEQFSAADIMMTISLEIADSLNLLEGHDNITRYLGDMQSREAYKKARAFG